MKRAGFSTRQLAALKLPGAPGSHQGWEKHAVTHGWEIREHPGRGRGGIVREFMPPPELADVIARHQAGKKLSVEDVRKAMGKPVVPGGAPLGRSAGRTPSAVKKAAKADLGAARFAAWLMARMMAHPGNATAAERQQLDRHELALRLLMLVAENERCALASLKDHPGIVDHAIDLAMTAKADAAP